MDDKLDIIESVRLIGDGFGWDIKCFADITEIKYYEEDSHGKEQVRSTMRFTSGYDIEVFKKALELREKSIKEGRGDD